MNRDKIIKELKDNLNDLKILDYQNKPLYEFLTSIYNKLNKDDLKKLWLVSIDLKDKYKYKLK